jgi:cytoplasmic iron level regulating protein YaaA (DUF328/UPF0246 family)
LNGVIYLITCVKKKLTYPSPAKDLYISALFKCLRDLVEESVRKLRGEGIPAYWYIVSAKYGLVNPDEILEPYEVTLKDKGRYERMRWASDVVEALIEELHSIKLNPESVCVVVLAGKDYREYLVPLLKQKGIKVLVPWEGLQGLGHIIRWCKERKEGLIEGSDSQLRCG